MKQYTDKTMLLPDTTAISILMAEKELDSKELASRSGLGVSIIYAMRRGCYIKPKYFGAVAKVLECSVKEIIATQDGEPVEYQPIKKESLFNGEGA